MIQTFCGPSLSLTHYSHAGSQPSLFEESAYQREDSPHEHGGDHQGLPSQMVHGEHAENVGRDLCKQHIMLGSNSIYITGRPDRMSHREWRETKQLPIRAWSGHQIRYCLVSLHFLCDILSGRSI